jgi:S1-C subfamily serine protease
MGHLGNANATVAWLRAASDPNAVAGAAFLISADRALTCAHVVRDHLGLDKPTPQDRPPAQIILKFEASGREVGARVAEGGWWPESVSGRLNDVAVLQLDEPLSDLGWAGLALSQPRPEEPCYIYGTRGGYQSIGQIVYAQLAAMPNARGWRQLDARPGRENSYRIRPGFSGSPVFDELGNTIWGMVVAVESDPGLSVAFAIPADVLRDALLPILQAYETQTLDFQSKTDRQSLVASKGTPQLGTSGPYSPELLERILEALDSLSQGDSNPAVAILNEVLGMQFKKRCS